MIDFLHKLFLSDFMSHGHCYFWRPEIVWLHATSDAVIALSYYVIPVVLLYLVRKRKDLPFHWVFFMFGLFILSCGTTHLMEIWTLWHGTYRLAGVIKAVTALASVATAVALVPMVPKALQLPSPAQLRAANLELQKEITERARVESALQVERNFVAAVLDTASTLILVLDLEGRVVQCNRACEQVSGWRTEELRGKFLWGLFPVPEEGEHFKRLVADLRNGWRPGSFESYWSAPNREARLISWSTTALADGQGQPLHIIAAGVDVTESKRLEKAILDISAREQRRIGQDLHDGLGQHMTGIAFLSKVLERKLADQEHPQAADASKLVRLANEAVSKTRELSQGLMPVGSDAMGLMSELERWSAELKDLFGVSCGFTCREPILVYNNNVATHLYRIAQEAVNNAIKHGQPTRIDIDLEKAGAGVTMRIRDNGVGLPEDGGNGRGIGLEIMKHRAKMIGGTLVVARAPKGGTVVTCQVEGGIGQEATDS